MAGNKQSLNNYEEKQFFWMKILDIKKLKLH